MGRHLLGRNLRGWTGAAAVLFSVAGAAWSGPFQDARARFTAGDYAGALTLLRQATQQEPNNPLVYAALGNTYRKLNDSTDALQAYDKVLELDPQLSAIPQKGAFAQAYAGVGGDPSRIPGGSPAATTSAGNGSSPADIINALSSTGVYVAPGLQQTVDQTALESAVQQALPRVIKIAAVGHTGDYANRALMADDLRQRLNVPDDGVVLVGTPKGISGSSAKLSHEQIDEALKKAGIDQAFAAGGLTQALQRATEGLSGGVAAQETRSTVGTGALAFGVMALIAVVVGVSGLRRKRAMDAARGPVEALRQETVAGLSYADGYLDLLPKGADADLAKARRAAAYEAYSTATGILRVAKSPDQVQRAHPLLRQALDDLATCRAAIDRATGGKGVAMSVPEAPNLKTDEQKGREYLSHADLPPVEAVQSAAQRDRLQRDIESIPASERGVSFFSGRPMPAGELVPVSMVIGGAKRTVMATRDEAAAINRGETPAVRAFADGSGRYTPWYEYRGYDPYRDYYSGWGGGQLGSLIDLYILTDLLGPGMWGGYGPWGFGGYGWGMSMPPTMMGGPGFYGGDGGYDPGGSGGDNGGFFGGGDGGAGTPNDAGGQDFFGQGGYTDPGNGFDTTGGNDAGSGFDFGGGGDAGGFDFGGGGDSGGGFDFGGGGDS